MRTKILITVLFASVLFSCKKTGQREETPPATDSKETTIGTSAKMPGTFTLYSPNIRGVLRKMNFGSPTAYWPPAAGGFVNNFSLTLDCNNQTVLNLNEVVLFGSGFPDKIKINGTLFTLVFDYSIQPCVRVYKLLNITSLAIGVDLNDPSTVLTFSYYYCDDVTSCDANTGTWQTGESYPLSQYACTAGSPQPFATSPAANQLRFLVPILGCIPPVFISDGYQFRYRIPGTTAWTESAVYPQSQYRFGVTINGVPSGTYEYEGRNVCSGSTGPWVIGNPMTVVVN